jgi:hypothetical protein
MCHNTFSVLRTQIGRTMHPGWHEEQWAARLCDNVVDSNADKICSDRRPIAKITEHGEATLLNGIRIATSLRQHAQLPALLAVHMQQPLQGREAVHLGRAVTLLKVRPDLDHVNSAQFTCEVRPASRTPAC